MKIPPLDQVEFDSFPTDERTKVCIFTKPVYPIPDLSHLKTENGRKLALYCTESTRLILARFIKKLPMELFEPLCTDKDWNLIDGTKVDGLDTPFKIACLPTGSVSDSVMLMIFSLHDPKKITLYTGAFQECREVLISDFFIKFKKFISDIYIDNTFANSKHMDLIQNASACNDIVKIIKSYPKHTIHLQMEPFDTLDLLVELARGYHVNVRLNILQQLFFYKSKYKHLFRYDAQIQNAADLNKKFLFKNKPEVHIVPYKVADLEAYKMYFNKEKIINIRLIACEKHIDVTPESVKKGLVYITYAGHAGATTLFSLINSINKLERIHPIIDDEGHDENPIFEGCSIVRDSLNQPSNGQYLEVTLEDIKPTPKQRSFLHVTTISLEDMISELSPHTAKSNQNQTVQSKRSSDESSDDEPVIIEISDDESVAAEATRKTTNKKRPPPASDYPRKSKYFKPNDANGNEIDARAKKSNGMQMKPANEPLKDVSNRLHETPTAMNDDDVSSLSSFPQLTFPSNYTN